MGLSRYSYWSGRKITLDADDLTKNLVVQRVVPQRSFLGPVLWNLLYDDLYQIELPEDVTLIKFADDVTIIVVANRRTWG